MATRKQAGSCAQRARFATPSGSGEAYGGQCVERRTSFVARARGDPGRKMSHGARSHVVRHGAWFVKFSSPAAQNKRVEIVPSNGARGSTQSPIFAIGLFVFRIW
jgi:hypothetical protein